MLGNQLNTQCDTYSLSQLVNMSVSQPAKHRLPLKQTVPVDYRLYLLQEIIIILDDK